MVLKHPPKPLPTMNASDIIQEIIPESTSRDSDLNKRKIGWESNYKLQAHERSRVLPKWLELTQISDFTQFLQNHLWATRFLDQGHCGKPLCGGTMD
ncbi:hypothetical protein J6590_007376 [Homalodisca vitripennis]|nr:hypothetical protein J6590_007376 [Homalodisca vitripennis]